LQITYCERAAAILELEFFERCFSSKMFAALPTVMDTVAAKPLGFALQLAQNRRHLHEILPRAQQTAIVLTAFILNERNAQRSGVIFIGPSCDSSVTASTIPLKPRARPRMGTYVESLQCVALFCLWQLRQYHVPQQSGFVLVIHLPAEDFRLRHER
jgi:hypothetical protein